MDRSIEKGKGDVCMGVWRRERAMHGWECREEKVRCVDRSVKKRKGDVGMGVWRSEWEMSGWKRRE